MEAGLGQSRKQRDKAFHQPRNRRDCLGELIQIDGSEHAWFEDRGPKCTLLVGTIATKYDGVDLPYSAFDKVRQVKQADIVSNERLGTVLKHVQEQQQIQAMGVRSAILGSLHV